MDRFLVFFPSRKCIKQVMINLICYEMCFFHIDSLCSEDWSVKVGRTLVLRDERDHVQTI